MKDSGKPRRVRNRRRSVDSRHAVDKATLLFTDIEDSTRLLQRLGDGTAGHLIADHRRLLRAAFDAAGGSVLETQGDAFLVVFDTAVRALQAAVEGQRKLRAHRWPEGAEIRVRMAVHAMDEHTLNDEYAGLDAHRAARICAAGHGGQILVSRSVRDVVSISLPAGIAIKDLGQHHFKDLSNPEHLYQLLVDGLPEVFPPLRSLAVLAHNLPVPLTSFVGRVREIQEIKDLLRTNRLLTLTGAGGCGKSRLALRVAADVTDRYADGVWLAQLAPLAESKLVPNAVATALGIVEQSGRSIGDTLNDQLRNRHLMLVLDNCEHLAHSCATLIQALLATCQNLQILTTSRVALGFDGEAIYRVPSLSVPDGQISSPTPEVLTRYDAVRLFAERATSILPAFVLTSSNGRAAAQVCRRLDGLPLAIELAAARIRVLTVEQIACRLDDRFRLLTSGNRAALPRHRTLRGTIDWSYESLSPREQVVLQRLSVFAGGCTLDAAEVVCSGGDIVRDDVLDILSSLVDKSLVLAEPWHEETRYRLLETLREYGRDRLRASGQTQEVRNSHTEWCLGLAEKADKGLRGAGQTEWLKRVQIEHDNLRIALEECRLRKSAEIHARLAVALYWFCNLRANFAEGRSWLDAVLARSSDLTDTMLAKVFPAAMHLTMRQGDLESAAAIGERGLALCERLQDKNGAARLFLWFGHVARRRGQHELAARFLRRSLDLSRALSDSSLSCMIFAGLGTLFRDNGHQRRADILHTIGFEIAKRSRDPFFIGIGLMDLGYDALKRGHHRRATEHFQEAVKEANPAGYRWLVADSLIALGAIASRDGYYERATRLFAAGEKLTEILGYVSYNQSFHEQWMASTKTTYGDAPYETAWRQGDAMTPDEAVQYALAPTESDVQTKVLDH